MHEDPNSRIHRPHPFHPQNRAATVQNHALGDGELLREIEHITSVPQISTTSPTNGNMSTTHANIPVASYFPSGYSDSSLPMGKYYPSNYESRKAAKSKSKKNKKRTASTSSADADAEHTSPEGPLSPTVVNAIESRRRLQQYQRDMMAQASMRAYELLAGSSVKGKGSSKHANLQGLKGLPPNSLSLGPSALRKPNSPRLHPLGSPGPVTPMELESDGVDGNYLNRGSAATSAHHPLENGYDAHST